MIDIMDKIRKPSIFILLLLLNIWFFFSFVFGDRQEILYMLIILFFFFSFDYRNIRREYLYWLLAFVALSLLEFSSHKLNVLTPIVLMHCIARFNIKEYLLYTIIILGGTALSLLVLVGTGNTVIGTGIDVIRVRHEFGYGHPNVAAMYYWGLFVSSILYCSLSKYRKLLWLLCGIVFIAALYLYSETNSRSFMVSLLAMFLVLGYYSVRSRFRENYVIGYSRYVLYALPVLFTALTVYFAIHAKEHSLLDLLLSMRLTLYKEFIDSLLPVHYLFGSPAFDYITVDNAYLHLLFEAGILLYALFIWLYYFAIKNIVKQQNYVIIAILAGFLVYGLMETLLLLPMIIGTNLFWVLLYRYRYGEDEELSPVKEIAT
jgi:hypothetical protein